MKKATYACIGFISLLILVHTNVVFAFDLVGKWERIEDHISGMSVEVYQVNDGYEAEIIYSPHSGFKTGDLKWASVTKKTSESYNLTDLTNTIDDNGRRIYVKKRLKVISSDLIHLRDYAEGNISGIFQKWTRISN